MSNNQSKDVKTSENNGSDEYQHLLKSMITINEELIRNKIQLENCATNLEKALYKMTHDLYSPLSNVEGLINILKINGSKDDDGSKAITDMISDAMVKFKIRIKELTDLSPIINCTFIKEDYKLEDILELVKQRLDNTITSSGAIIQSSFKMERNSLCYESNYCILHNLLNQALLEDNMDRTPQIAMKSYQDGNYNVIEMEDGNSKESVKYLNSLTEMPYKERLSNHVNGLYIIKKIAEYADGGVELNSLNGTGILYKVYFK